MASEQVSAIISLISQRIVLAPPQLEAPRGVGRGTAIKRYKEGLTTGITFRREMESLGYPQAEIDKALVQADLERDYDLFTDRLSSVKSAFAKGVISDAEMQTLVTELIPDAAKAAVQISLVQFSILPKPKPMPPPPEAPTA